MVPRNPETPMTRSRLTLLVTLLVTFGLSGTAVAGKKNTKKAQEEPVAAPAPKKVKTNLPGDATSKSFGQALMSSTIVEFEPPGDGGLTFMYESFTFKEGNVWQAAAYLDAGDEVMRCAESGTWTIDAAESASTAPVNWTVTKTDCPMREAGKKGRALMTIQDDGDVSVEYR